MGEIDHPEHAEHQREAGGDDAIDATQEETIDKGLKHMRPVRLEGGPATWRGQGNGFSSPACRARWEPALPPWADRR